MDDFSIFDTDEWIAAYEDLKAKAVQFMADYAELQGMSDVAAIDPVFAARRQKLLDRGGTIYNTVENVRSFANTVYNWIDNFGLGDLSGHLGLGAFWIPVTVVLGISAAIVKWVSDAAIELKEGRLIRQLQSEGYTTEEAIKMARGSAPDPFGIKTMIPWVIAGIAAVFIVPRLLR